MKKLAGIPSGAGWRARGRGYAGEGTKARMVGYRFLHSVIDDRTRIVYTTMTRQRSPQPGSGPVPQRPVDRYHL